jgi:hypothetical protein
MFISDLRKGDYKLPESVININLKKTLNAYDETKHLLSVSGQVDKYFNKRQKSPFTPSELKSDKDWKEVGIPPDGLDFQTIDEKIRNGRRFDTYAWIPNNAIFTNTIHNRGDNINFTNVFTHLDLRGGLFWQAMNITVVTYYDKDGTYKFVTVIGNHCIAKSIIVCGNGAPVFARVVCLGKEISLDEIIKFGAKIHHTDSDRRTNQGAEARLVSGTHAGEKQYENTMKVLCDLGFDIKKQVKPNGKVLKKVSSAQALMGIIKEFDYDIVKDNVNLIIEAYPRNTTVLTGALSVLTTIRYYFDEKANKISKEEFRNFFLSWAELNDQEDIFPNSGKNKDVMVPVYEMIKSINKWSKKNLGRKQVLISRKDIFKVIPEEKLENI